MGEYKAKVIVLAGSAFLPMRPQLGVVFHDVHRYGELWCDAILPADRIARVTRGAKRKAKPKPSEDSSVRATISFPSEIYQTLEDIARQKKVSLAWVVREASEQYIADKWPLLAPRKGA